MQRSATRVRISIPVLTACTLSASIALAQTPTFAPRVDFGMAQENAQQSVCFDFDQDGNLDVANTMEGYNQGKIEVLFGDGAADFGSSTEVVSYVAWGLAAFDLDADGWLDLAATSYGWSQHGVRMFRNDHAGGFTYAGMVSTLATPPVALVPGDFDADGIVDLAAISEGGGWAVDWFRANGNGTFSTFRPVPNTLGLVGRSIESGDFDGDGLLDLLAVHSTGVMVLKNNAMGLGVGTFASTGGIAITESMDAAAVADLDADGVLDVVTAGTNLRVWHGMGNGTFVLASTPAVLNGTHDLDLADLDSDGVLDVLVTDYSGVRIAMGLGGGAFVAPTSLATGTYPVACVQGDWNGDGWMDLAVTCKNLAGASSFLAIHLQVPPAVGATATVYGSGCGTPTLALLPVASARPVLGTNARADVQNAPTAFTALALGFSDQWADLVPLPLALDAVGMPGCVLLQSSEWTGLPSATGTGGLRTFSLAIPMQNELLSLPVFLQAYSLAPGANAMQVIASNGLQWVLGNQ